MMEKLIDFRKKELNIGDKVAYISGGRGGAVYLEEGEVTGFTKTLVKVSDRDRFGVLHRYTNNIKPARLTKI